MDKTGLGAEQRGSILVLILVFALVVGAASAALIAESNAGLRLRRMRSEEYRALMDCLNGIEMARNAVETSDYDEAGRNLVLWNIDRTQGDGPGASPLIENGRVTVTVSCLGNSWYELEATASSSDGTITRKARLRVREKDFFSRYALFIENGDVNIADNTSYYGPVHVNKNISFKDSVRGQGAQCFGFISSTLPFTFNGNAKAETKFYQGFANDLGRDGWINLPPRTSIKEYEDLTGAYGPGAQTLWSQGPGQNDIKLLKGPGGFTVSGGYPWTYIELIYDRATKTQYVQFTIKDTARRTLYVSPLAADFEMGEETIIHVDKSIKGLKGELRKAATIVSENGDIGISADLYYVDDEGDHPMIFDPSRTENDQYLRNPAYEGDAVLGVVAYSDVFYVGDQDDANLEINGVLVAMTGAVKWSGVGDKGHLRVFGSRISDNQTYRYSGNSGYNDSGVYIYDDNLRYNPPPSFLPVQKPLFMGFEVVK